MTNRRRDSIDGGSPVRGLRSELTAVDVVLTGVGLFLVGMAAGRLATAPSPNYDWVFFAATAFFALWAVSFRIRRRRNRIRRASPPDAVARGKRSRSTEVGERPLLEARGANGSLLLFSDRVRLVKRGFRATVGVGYGAGSKDIALSQVTAVQWRDAGDVLVGFLAFSFIGGADPTGGVFSAVRSENAVTFTREQQPAFEKVRDVVRRRIGSTAMPSMPRRGVN